MKVSIPQRHDDGATQDMIEKKCLGIIGGLGPMASAQFMTLLTAMTDADCDNAHPEAILYSRPGTPDRTAFILGESSDSPLPSMIYAGKALEEIGAQVLAIPCMTAYGFYDDLKAAFHAELIHPIERTAAMLSRNGIRAAGIMATDGSLQAGIFRKALEEKGIKAIIPDAKRQSMVMRIIYEQVKAGKPANLKTFSAVRNHLMQKGAEVTLLGCTELSVVKQMQHIGDGYLDVMEVLAASALKACGYKVRKERMPAL